MLHYTQKSTEEDSAPFDLSVEELFPIMEDKKSGGLSTCGSIATAASLSSTPATASSFSTASSLSTAS